MNLFGIVLATALTFTAPTPTEEVGVVYVGDSRFVGMEETCHISDEDNKWVVAKVGRGLDWLKSDGIENINKIVEDNDGIDRWVLVSGLGVNDPWNVDDYITYYSELDDNFDVVLVSVNPVDRVKCDKYGNDYAYLSGAIDRFNRKLQYTDYDYIDVYTDLVTYGFETIDGVHYKSNTYDFIYRFIESHMDYETLQTMSDAE